FNGDGFVDGADLLVWQQNLGLSSGATQGQGNANSGVDGAVDAADLAIWNSQFGSAHPVPGAAAVPEPAAWILAVGGGWIAAHRRRRR
ncbi:MAG TPA: PEP-CTERM sorting domain-containing protein, partial [Lacipirellula sp.]